MIMVATVSAGIWVRFTMIVELRAIFRLRAPAAEAMVPRT